MANVISAFDFLASPQKYPMKPLCVLFGDESFLMCEVSRSIRSLMLKDEDAEFSFSHFDGTIAVIRDVIRDVSTATMFGGDRRLVLVEAADSFVGLNRERLEAYCENPSPNGVLLLQLQSFPSNTRLYQKVAGMGILIDCKAVPQEKIASWLVTWAKWRHHVVLALPASELLVELVGNELGLLDQELARLALFVSTSGTISIELVRQHVGNWRQKKVWDMLDAALFGRTSEAIRQLNQLMGAGESAIGLLAQIAPTLRRFAAATRLFLEQEKQGKRILLADTLQIAGFKFSLKKSTEQMKYLGRFRGEKILSLLVKTDLELKGDSRCDPKMILERFLVRLSHPEMRFKSLDD